MRENPWHLRLPNVEHYQWFKNLVDLHELTANWTKQLQMVRPSYALTRGLGNELSENIWLLDSISEKTLDQFLDDSFPTELLERLEEAIWTVQAWTVSSLYGRTPQNNQESLDRVLEQICWKLGKSCAESRWGELIKRNVDLPLRDVLLAVNDSPLASYPHKQRYFIKRAIQKEIQIELFSCPHQSQYSEAKLEAKRLCHLHSHWLRGFVYALNHRIGIEHHIQTPYYCTQKWSLS